MFLRVVGFRFVSICVYVFRVVDECLCFEGCVSVYVLFVGLYVCSLFVFMFSGLCIVRFESNYDTGSEYVLNGKTHRGLFGISEDHCKPHKRANESGLPCTNLCTSTICTFIVY